MTVRLYYQPFCPHSIYGRLLMAEYGFDAELVEEWAWHRRSDFLLLNPAGTLPVLTELHRPPVVGVWALSEYLDETRGERLRSRRLMPDGASDRAEIRRLTDWFHSKFFQEVSSLLTEEKINKRFQTAEGHRQEIDMAAIHAARKNLRHHLSYLEHLLGTNPWIGSEKMSHADFAAAAHLMCLDYFADIPWEEAPRARDWYGKMKCRPSFRPLLSARIPATPPAPHFENPDF